MTSAAPGDHRDRTTSWEFATSESLSPLAPNEIQGNQSGQEHDFDAMEEAIRVLAYFKWEAAGSPEGDGVDYWLEAEREINTNPPGSFSGG